MLDLMKRFVKEEDGATMVEYGLMVALIAVVCVLAIYTVGQSVNETFESTDASLQSAIGHGTVAP
jgi:pilus assembly protein Flp/PilA